MTPTHQRVLHGHWLAALLVAPVVIVVLAACSTLESPTTQDIVAGIPWVAPEEHAYALYDDSDLIGRTTLSVDREGDTFVLRQRSEDDDGNVDESEVVVDAKTLKPLRGLKSITDEDQRNAAEYCYETVGGDECPDEKLDASECDSGIIVGIAEQVFDPPDETTPAVPRRAPLCVPEHSYDNDSSLFLWRTIPFEEGYLANYTTILTGTRRKQTVRIEVLDRVTETQFGDDDAWVVDIAADGKTQRAWFSTDDDHRLLAYQNGGFTFELEE
jgi:hypothetical protein